MRSYVSLFCGEIFDLWRYGPVGRVVGSIAKASFTSFTIGGQLILCTDSTVKHDFTFTLFVTGACLQTSR